MATRRRTMQAMTDPIDAIRDYWDAEALGYDHLVGHGLTSLAKRVLWLRVLASLLPPTPPRRVLDAGTGTGTLALLLAELGHHVVGVDVAPSMLARARQKA